MWTGQPRSSFKISTRIPYVELNDRVVGKQCSGAGLALFFDPSSPVSGSKGLVVWEPWERQLALAKLWNDLLTRVDLGSLATFDR